MFLHLRTFGTITNCLTVALGGNTVDNESVDMKAVIILLSLAAFFLIVARANQPPTEPDGVAPTKPQGGGTVNPVTVDIESDALVVTNNTDNLIGYEAFPEEILVTIEWAPCDDPGYCQDRIVVPDETRRVDLRRLINKDTTVLVVFWWPLVEQADGQGYVVTDVHDVMLNLSHWL